MVNTLIRNLPWQHSQLILIEIKKNNIRLDRLSVSGSVSTLLIPSGGIDIVDKTGQHDDDHLQGNSEGETAIPEGEQVEKEKDVSSSEADHEDKNINEQQQEEEFHGESREGSLEQSETSHELVSL